MVSSLSWLLLAIFRAARAAYTVVNWMLLTSAWIHWRKSRYYGAAGRRRELSVAGRRSGSNIYSASLLDVATFYSASF